MFDFVIVIIVSIVGLDDDDTVAGLNVIRLLLRALIMTLAYALPTLPSLMNIALLLLVTFFIFAIFGVELFGKVVHSDGYGNPVLTTRARRTMTARVPAPCVRRRLRLVAQRERDAVEDVFLEHRHTLRVVLAQPSQLDLQPDDLY